MRYTLSAEKRAQAKEYARARHVLYFAGEGILLGMLILLTRRRGAAWLQGRWAAPRIVLMLLAGQLPLEAYEEHLARFYGQSIESWTVWLGDELKIWAVTLVVGTLGIWGLYAAISRWPRRWWLVAWLLSLPVQVAAVFLEPYVIEPLFFRFQPLAQEHPEVAADIERIVARAGMEIPRGRLLEMKASEKTNSLNAYVSGFGASKRVVLWDTIIAKESGAPLLTTIGHELGHYALGHVRDGLLFGFAASLAGLFLLFTVVKRGPAAPPLPDLLLFAALLSFLGTPAVNGFSRMQEHEADRYSLEVTHGLVADAGQAAAIAFQVEGESALADPDPSPFIEFWLYDHPPLAGRLRFSLEYDPWHGGAPPRYVR